MVQVHPFLLKLEVHYSFLNKTIMYELNRLIDKIEDQDQCFISHNWETEAEDIFSAVFVTTGVYLVQTANSRRLRRKSLTNTNFLKEEISEWEDTYLLTLLINLTEDYPGELYEENEAWDPDLQVDIHALYVEGFLTLNAAALKRRLSRPPPMKDRPIDPLTGKPVKYKPGPKPGSITAKRHKALDLEYGGAFIKRLDPMERDYLMSPLSGYIIKQQIKPPEDGLEHTFSLINDISRKPSEEDEFEMGTNPFKISSSIHQQLLQEVENFNKVTEQRTIERARQTEEGNPPKPWIPPTLEELKSLYRFRNKPVKVLRSKGVVKPKRPRGRPRLKPLLSESTLKRPRGRPCKPPVLGPKRPKGRPRKSINIDNISDVTIPNSITILDISNLTN